MKLKKLFLVFAVAGFVFTSCEKEETPKVEQEMATDAKVPKPILERIAALHFNTDGVKIGKVMRPDGSYEKVYIVEDDIAFTEAQLKGMSAKDLTTKQYRTYNLVSSPRVIDVVGFLGGTQALTAKQKEALENAIAEYNALDIGLSFNLRFGVDFEAADMVVYQTPGAPGGVSGFPVAGDPYKFVQVFSGLENYSLGVNTHVMIHEIGHTLGLRHTDWYSRQSCGRPSFGELSGMSGAVHVPGTPRRYDPTSIMLACFSASETGEFGPYDIVALEYLY